MKLKITVVGIFATNQRKNQFENETLHLHIFFVAFNSSSTVIMML